MADRDLQTFVSDGLHRIVGYAEKNLAQYVLALGTSGFR